MSKLCMVIPAYNEGSRLPVATFQEYLSTHPDISMILVDDGSRDQTFEKFRELQKAFPDQIDILKLERNSGKAEAVRQGILAASKKAPFTGFWDADLATPLWEIDNFLNEFQIKDSLDICCGCRLERLGADIRRKTSRHHIGRIIATFISRILKVPFYDTQCGAKIFRSDCVPDLFEEPFRTRWVFDVEIFLRYISIHGDCEASERILEYPLHQWHDVAGSKLSWRSSFKIFRELYLIWRIGNKKRIENIGTLS